MKVQKPLSNPATRAADDETTSVSFSSADWETLVFNAPIAMAILDRKGTVQFGNQNWEDEGWPERCAKFAAGDAEARHALRRAFLSVLRGCTQPPRISEIALGDGDVQFARWSLNPWRIQDGQAQGAILYVRDVSLEVQSKNLAMERQAFLEAILNNIDDAVIACDANGDIKYSNRKMLDYQYEPNAGTTGADEDNRMLLDRFRIFKEGGMEPQERSGLPLRQALAGNDVRKLPLVYKINDTTMKYVEVTSQLIVDEGGTVNGAVSSMYDVTERMETERQLRRSEAEARRVAYTDALTGYPNRLSLQRTLQQDMSTLCDKGEKVLLLSIDIHRFKAINSIHGEAIGDRLLAEVADRLADLAGPRAIAGRLAGDEFLIIAPASKDNPLELAETIRSVMDGQHLVDGHRIPLQTMIGAAAWPKDGATGAQLLKRADMARRAAKKSKFSSLVRFHADMEKDATRTLQIEQDLRKTIQNDGLEVAYQPIIDAKTGQALGFEALCRWIHPEQGFIPPDQFIAVAEQTGDILDLGEWIIRKVTEDLTDHPDYFVAVNVSPMQFNDDQFIPRLKAALVEFDFDPSRLEIEVTESLVVHDPERVLAQIRELQALGIRVALDDFGTGYSSLAYLQTYKFDKLKIDRSFVSKLGKDREALALVQCMIQMGQTMNMTVIAEGIETEGQALMLRHAGCDNFQGYFYARPMPWQDVLETCINADQGTSDIDEGQRPEIKAAS